MAVTAKEGLVVGVLSMPGNPYNGHTVDSRLEQVDILSDESPRIVLVDRGYRRFQAAGETRLLVSRARRLP